MGTPPTIAYVDEFIRVDDTRIASWKVHMPANRRLPILEGDCPFCHDECYYPVPEEVLQGATPSAAQDERPPQLTRLIICNCRSAHQRPEGVKLGCGRYWLARLVKSGNTYTLSAQRDLGMLPAAAALADAVAAQDTRVQKAAEKWTGGIAALYGLFSLASVATAKDALKGLSTGHRWLIAATMLTAVVAAASALWLSYVAAYGWLRMVGLTEGDEQLQRWHDREGGYAARGARRLRWAIYAAFGSLAAITAMMLLVWFLPRA
jgi:hypothetical protein